MIVILTIIWLMYMFYRTKKALHMLQQNLYDDDFRYIKWIKNNFNKVMLSFHLSQVFLIFFILCYFYIYINTNILNNYFNSYFSSEEESNIKSRLLYDSLNKIVSLSDINNFIEEKEEVLIINKNENNDIKIDNSKPIVYIYNTHDTEKYSVPFISDYSVTPTVKMVSYIFKEHLNNEGISVLVENKKIKDYLTKHKLNYYGCYDASRSYIKEASKNNDFKILIDLHRDSVKYKQTLYTKDNKKYAKVMFVVTTKHKSYKKNLKFAEYLDNKLNQDYKGLSRGIYKRSDVIFNQDLNDNAILIELGGVDNQIEELNNTLEILSKIIKEYLGETYG